MIRRMVLLLLVVPVVAACMSKSATRDEVKSGKMHDVFPPAVRESAAAGPAGAPATQSATVAPEPEQSAPAESAHWPLAVSAGGVNFQVHEPLLDAWHDNRLTAHSLVLAQPGGQKQNVPGTVLMTATTQVDRAAGTVALREMQVTGSTFSADPATAPWTTLLRKALPENIKTVGLARLDSGRSIVQARERAAATASVPAVRIIVSQKPAVLVYIDGAPRYVPVQNANLTGVVNTQVILLKSGSGKYYLHLYNGWVSGASLQGPWTIASAPPGASDVEQAARASQRANLLLGKPDSKGRGATLAKGSLPQIIVSTTPAALIVLDGAPTFVRMPGTDLQYATNTSAHLFRDVDSKSLYARAGGYWFRAGSVAGPWAHVAAASLPAAFSAIPDDSPKRGVKSSIAAAQRPDSAALEAPAVVAADPKTTRLSYTMSGDPVLEPIPGTQLNYVSNASVPMIQLDINNWYAIQNAVWFHAGDATGPWTVTDQVPSEIYAIPPTVPIYH